MSLYNYKARDAAGKVVKGAMEAPGKTDLIDKLNKMGYMTTSVTEVVPGIKLESIFDKVRWVSTDDMLVFYVQLSNMISAGISILTSLDTIAKQIENKTLKEAVGDVARQVEAGSNLSQAFASRLDVFNPLFVNMIKAGEASGHLDTVLMRYALFFERQEDLKEKVKGALLYPMILLCAGIAVSLFIVTFVIPQFAELYIKAGVRLPVPTLIVYKAGLAIKHYWYALIVIIAIIAAAIKYFLKIPKGILFMDTLKLRVSIIGPLHRKVAISRFARTLATLLGGGVPILEALDITKGIVGNVVLARVIETVSKYVEKGEQMAEPLRVSGEFPSDVVQMISAGEEMGNLDGMLNKVADFYDMTVGYAVKKLTTIIEPVFLVIMGVMVGTIMASMLMPIFDMVKTLKH
ncbi:MAG: type II secretion system F family protein [Candidatus Omnitrophota bacterium]